MNLKKIDAKITGVVIRTFYVADGNITISCKIPKTHGTVLVVAGSLCCSIRVLTDGKCVTSIESITATLENDILTVTTGGLVWYTNGFCIISEELIL